MALKRKKVGIRTIVIRESRTVWENQHGYYYNHKRTGRVYLIKKGRVFEVP